MPALWRVGESAGPGTVVSDEFTIEPDGRTIERVVMSWGQEMVMFGREPETYFTKTRTPASLELGTSRVIVPFTVRHPETESGAPEIAEWVDVSDGPFDYWNALRDHWLPGNDLTVIEHDVQARPDIFESFDSCSEPWCYFRYDNHTPENAAAWHWGILGCTRFRKELIASVPGAIADIEERWRDWHYTSTGLGVLLRGAGYEPHVHEPPVNHHRMMDLREAGLFA